MSQIPPPSVFDQPRPVSAGLAIAALVCAIVGMFIPGVGLVGLILGIVAMLKASSSPQTHGGKGMAIAAIIVGAVSLFASLMCIGIMLPALGKARASARQLKSAAQLRNIDTALLSYASDNKGWLPEPGADWQARIASYVRDPGDFISPRSESATAANSYIYISGFNIGTISSPARTVVAYENPECVPRSMLMNVAFMDGHVEAIATTDLQRTLGASEQPAGAPAPKPSGSRPGGRP